MNNNNCTACPDTYTVVAGDTLYSIAGKYNVPVRLLMAANKITNPYNLRIGRELIIPDANARPYRPAPPAAGRPQNPNTPAEPVCRGTRYTVAEGDSFYLIAQKHRININALLAANPNIDPQNLIIGTEICIPR